MGKKKSTEGDTYVGHAGDCTIRASLDNVSLGPAAGICTCGYGWRTMQKTGDMKEMYSDRLKIKIQQVGELERRLSEFVNSGKHDGVLVVLLPYNVTDGGESGERKRRVGKAGNRS